MDPQRHVCMGCARTLDEIARWGVLGDEQRAAIMGELPMRRERLQLPPVSFEDDSHGA
jgi:predicted Fe-S protein YdhL (DUF1289 family)